MQPIKIRQFRQKAQNKRQFGRGMVAKIPFLPAFSIVEADKMNDIKEKRAHYLRVNFQT